MDEFFSESQARLTRPLPTLIPRCGACGLYQHAQTPKMKPDGRGEKKILIVGEYPGKAEDSQGKPLVGGVGQWLETRCQSVGINLRRDCWLDNASRCLGANDHPTSVSDCRPNILKYIAEKNPVVIVLLGTDALQSVVGHFWKADVGAVSKWIGYRIPCTSPNAWIVPLYNPAHLMRDDNPIRDKQFMEGLKWINKQTARPWKEPPNYESQVEVIPNPEEAAKRLACIRDGIIAFDFETNCIKPEAKTSEIVCASVCCGKETFAFPWTGRVKDVFRDVMEDDGVRKIGFNVSFEDGWCRTKLGIQVRGWCWDGMLSAHALDPTRGVTGLKFQAWVRLGAPEYNSHIEPMLESEKKGGYERNRVREIELPLILFYCGMDSLLEFQVAKHQAKELGVTLGE